MTIKKAPSLLGRETLIHRRSLFAINPSMNMDILTHGTASATGHRNFSAASKGRVLAEVRS